MRNTETVVPAGLVPEMVRFLAVVMPSLLFPVLGLMPVTLGCCGWCVRMTTLSGAEDGARGAGDVGCRGRHIVRAIAPTTAWDRVGPVAGDVGLRRRERVVIPIAVEVDDVERLGLAGEGGVLAVGDARGAAGARVRRDVIEDGRARYVRVDCHLIGGGHRRGIARRVGRHGGERGRRRRSACLPTIEVTMYCWCRAIVCPISLPS